MSMSIFISLLSFILFFNFTLFYLDDFNLSTNKYIKLLQIKIFIIIFLILSILALLYFIITLTLFVKYSRAQDKNNIPAPEYVPKIILN